MEDKRTELEKRWEEEEDDILAEEEFSGEDEDLEGSSHNYIMDPLAPNQALVMAFCGPRAIVAGLVSMSEGSTELTISNPLLYAEEASRTPEGQVTRRPVLARIANFTALPDILIVHPDFFHFLRNNSMKNMDLAAAYADTVKRAIADDAGIQPPTDDDVMNVTRLDLNKQ